MVSVPVMKMISGSGVSEFDSLTDVNNKNLI